MLEQRETHQPWQGHASDGANQLHCLAIVDVTVPHSELLTLRLLVIHCTNKQRKAHMMRRGSTDVPKPAYIRTLEQRAGIRVCGLSFFNLKKFKFHDISVTLNKLSMTFHSLKVNKTVYFPPQVGTIYSLGTRPTLIKTKGGSGNK